jgi:hypothetical protein
MKTRAIILFTLTIALTGCDNITNPIESTTIRQPTDTLARAIVLEDFTGHQCSNCPDATKEAKRLQALYGNQLIIIAPHVGHFANTNGDFSRNFKVPEGEELNQFFGINGALPSGLVNRRRTNNVWKLNYLSWGSAAQTASLLRSPFLLTVSSTYNPATREIQLQSNILVATLPQRVQHNIMVYLTEDSVLSPQLHKPPVGIVSDYFHRYVFRGSLNGTFGEMISSGDFVVGDTIKRNFTGTLNAEWNASTMHAVVLVAQHTNTQREIVQARQVKLIP